jgi:hypothetical protein
MNSDVVGFIALNEILGFFFGGVVDVAFEFYVGNDFLRNRTSNETRFRIPLDVIAAFKGLGHLCAIIGPKMHLAKQWSRGKRYQRRLQHHVEYRLPALAFDQLRALRTAWPY